MTRLIVTLIVAGAIAGAIAWVAATPGGVVLTIGTYQARMSVGIAFVLLLAAAFVLMLVLKLLALFWRIPRLFRRETPARKERAPEPLTVKEAAETPAPLDVANL
jgi:uncharacterized membrane-anchored protein